MPALQIVRLGAGGSLLILPRVSCLLATVHFAIAMGIKSLFLGKNSNSNDSGADLQKSALPYDSILVSTPPVKGAYPVAGNGPNVLDQIQQTRAQRHSAATAEAALSVPPLRDDSSPRPRTAPYDTGGGLNIPRSSRLTEERASSGFSMTSPSTLTGNSSTSRRDSARSNIDLAPLSSNPIPYSIPRVLPPASRDVKGYIPTNGSPKRSPALHDSMAYISPSLHQDNRDAPQASHKSYVDLLVAHSAIRQTREASLHRFKASGVRVFGEDVADRNIDAFGERVVPDPNLDLKSPELSYLKGANASKRGLVRAELPSRMSSALGHASRTDGNSGDDISSSPSQSRIGAMSSTESGLGPLSPHPPRIDSASAASLSYGTGRSREDRLPTQSIRAEDLKGRAVLALSSPTVSIAEEPLPRYHKPLPYVISPRIPLIPPIPERGRRKPVPTRDTTATTSTSAIKSDPLPALPPGKFTSTPHKRHSSIVKTGESSSSHIKRRSMSASSQSTVVPPTVNERKDSRKSSATFATLREQGTQHSSRPLSVVSSQRQMIVEGANQPPSLDSVIDSKDSVDADVTRKQLPGRSPRSRSAHSRHSIASRYSTYSAPFLSPLHVTPHSIIEPPSFPPTDWRLSSLHNTHISPAQQSN